MTSEATEGLQFMQPPVRQVTLTLYFSSEAPVQAHHVAPLNRRWAETFPAVTERPPLPGRDEFSPVAFLSDGEAWPVPYTTYQGSDRSMSFQGDRFEVMWNFRDGGNPPYPGFEALLAGLQSAFREFTDVLAEHQVQPRVEAVECYYVNEIETVDAGQLAVGVLTGWAGAVPASERSEQYVGVRLQRDTGKDGRCTSLVMVDSSQDGAPLLALRLSRRLEEQHADVVPAMREVHEELVAQFLIHTSEDMHREWGKTS